jgi:hypothetical protein
LSHGLISGTPRRSTRYLIAGGESANPTRNTSRGPGRTSPRSTAISRVQSDVENASSPPSPVASDPPPVASNSGAWKYALYGHITP